jgi:GNAT superfamily N-acetyltransferase
MISIKKLNELTQKEIIEINNLISICFATNRLKTYNIIIYYKNIIDDNIIGFIGLQNNKYKYINKDIIILNQLCVKYEYRNRGIATYILNFLKNIYENIIYILYIDKNKNNTKILYNFYIKNGFQEINNKILKKININYDKKIEYLMINNN